MDTGVRLAGCMLRINMVVTAARASSEKTMTVRVGLRGLLLVMVVSGFGKISPELPCV